MQNIRKARYLFSPLACLRIGSPNRPGKSRRQAVTRAVYLIREEAKGWDVDLDLSRCFDTLDHDIILRSFRRKVADGSILGLIRLFLQSGVMVGGVLQPSAEGSPQGGVISPLVSNVYLDAFDRQMSGLGHTIGSSATRTTS